ncbi:MAG: hypothetical protein QM487_00075 [Candidatus Marithrix sp.]
MKLLKSSNQISESLKECPPCHIAVAYLGLNWDNYINVKIIKSIVLSPTVGTNPLAVASLVKAIGWDKVYFLPQLHSKIYLSEGQVILGSANLSKNGLGDNEQYESGVSSSDPNLIIQTKELYESYIKKSEQLYSSEDSKIEELRNLWDKHNIVRADGGDNDPKISRTFMEYDPILHEQFYIIGYVEGDIVHTDNIPKIITNKIVDEISLSPKDSIEVGKWVLCWKKNKNNTVNRVTNITWMYIHELYSNGCDEKGYEDVGIQREKMKLPDQPFVLKKGFKDKFTKIIEGGQYDEFRDSPHGEVNSSRFTEFIREIQDIFPK